ncbi:hypothetical protein BEWA_049760 [Theileria equi strain WA]|uniref:Uncharacterized protein n=1 Tax=Theileria equi strain WA TaxID=1537102 RepID=L1LB62_THEEQ|nr:hypothetical protein BEWA_049760 [Theileria equi strain WA]EKX72509.1 hypothetical protein BEWA_049760 [Theileria equi strain WA]|eukprot:XP_004831961.1 hypothetical protein BEWA_049760 [Theileria equi strain WA]
MGTLGRTSASKWRTATKFGASPAASLDPVDEKTSKEWQKLLYKEPGFTVPTRFKIRLPQNAIRGGVQK